MTGPSGEDTYVADTFMTILIIMFRLGWGAWPTLASQTAFGGTPHSQNLAKTYASTLCGQARSVVAFTQNGTALPVAQDHRSFWSGPLALETISKRNRVQPIVS